MFSVQWYWVTHFVLLQFCTSGCSDRQISNNYQLYEEGCHGIMILSPTIICSVKHVGLIFKIGINVKFFCDFLSIMYFIIAIIVILLFCCRIAKLANHHVHVCSSELIPSTTVSYYGYWKFDHVCIRVHRYMGSPINSPHNVTKVLCFDLQWL